MNIFISSIYLINEFQDLIPERYEFKFIVDNIWRCSKDYPTVIDEKGNLNNFLDLRYLSPNNNYINNNNNLINNNNNLKNNIDNFLNSLKPKNSRNLNKEKENLSNFK